MFSLSPRLSKSQEGRERSPFSSPSSNLHASPIAVRRASVEERRRPAAKFDPVAYSDPTDRIEEHDEEEEDGEEDEQEEADEDEAGELSPLLPIFSAAQLGVLTPFS